MALLGVIFTIISHSHYSLSLRKNTPVGLQKRVTTSLIDQLIAAATAAAKGTILIHVEHERMGPGANDAAQKCFHG